MAQSNAVVEWSRLRDLSPLNRDCMTDTELSQVKTSDNLHCCSTMALTASVCFTHNACPAYLLWFVMHSGASPGLVPLCPKPG